MSDSIVQTRSTLRRVTRRSPSVPLAQYGLAVANGGQPTQRGDNSIEVRFGSSLNIVDDELSFGRSGDIVIDDANRYLHRVVGEFVPRGPSWSLHNRGTTIQLRLFAIDGVHTVLPPGGHTMLGAHTGTVSFAAGPGNYELTYRMAHAPDRAELGGGARADLAGAETAEFGAPLTPREVDFMVAFARPILTASGQPTPTYAEVAAEFGVKPKTVDATIQRLRHKMYDAGVVHLSSTESLVTHLLATGKITYTHLLEQPTD